MYEDHHAYAVAELAERLDCRPTDIKPCLLEAYRLQPEELARDQRRLHATTYFVGAELLSIIPTLKSARRQFRQWGTDKGVDRARIEQLLAWFPKRPWSRRGCRRDQQVKRLCCGRRNCGWYARGPWKERAGRDCDLKTFYLRAWPEELVARAGSRFGQQAIRVYQGLCAFEAHHGIKPGSRLFFTKVAARAFCDNMRDEVQRRALLCLRENGLVRIPSWGRPRTKGKPNQPRTVRRVVPVPYAKT